MKQSKDIYDKQYYIRGWKGLAEAVLLQARKDADSEWLESDDAELYKDLSGNYTIHCDNDLIVTERKYAETHTVIEYAKKMNVSVYYAYMKLQRNEWSFKKLTENRTVENLVKYKKEINELLHQKVPAVKIAAIFSVPQKHIDMLKKQISQ